MSIANTKVRRSKTKKPRWKRRPGARPVEISEAALNIFADRGFEAATMDEIAERAGVSKGTIYLYYPSKEDLLIDSIEHRIRANQLAILPIIQLASSVSGKKLTASSVRNIFTKIVDTIFDVLCRPESRQLIKVIMSERSRSKRLREKQAELANIGIAALTEFLKRAHSDGAIVCPNPMPIAKSLVGMNFTIVFLNEFLNPGSTVKIKSRDRDSVLEFAFRGLGLSQGG